ncbi:MAG: SpoIID/LytB domain-containing protein [Nocardioidaceae bacterium]
MSTETRRRGARTIVSGGAVAALVLATPMGGPAAAKDQVYYVPISKSWTVTGHGYGHGHGLSQYGAQGAALQGKTYRQILGFYYPGTARSQVKGRVRVLISADTTSDLQVRPGKTLKVRDLESGDVWSLPTDRSINRWRLRAANDTTAVHYHDARGWHRWRIPDGGGPLLGAVQFERRGPLTLLVPGGSDVVGRAYRGALRLAKPYPGADVRDTVNVLSMDAYVQGVVPYEMPTSWEQQALRSQAVAARTYATWQRAQNPRRYYQICDTTACQVYGGVGAEVRSSNDAVQATAGEILTYGGKPAFTQFSASSGGWTSAGSVPYLPAKQDPYDDFPGNSVHTWTTKVSAASLEALHPNIGRLVKLRVTQREGHGQWGGRVRQIVLDGTAGTAYMTGDDFRWHFGLRSSWFSIAPTPIIVRWRKIGGAKSIVGRPRSGEYAIDRGAVQEFEKGRIFWSSSTGARELKGNVLRAYRDFGGPSSRLGWPVTGMLQAGEHGRTARFQGGRIYASRATDGHVLYGPILKRYRQEGGPTSWIGFPATNVRELADGDKRARFQHAVLTFDASTHEVQVRRL